LGRPTMAMVGTPTVAAALIDLELIRVKLAEIAESGPQPARQKLFPAESGRTSDPHTCSGLL
jgi:hypothetical protein